LLEACDEATCGALICEPPASPLTYLEQIDYSTVRMSWQRVPAATVYQIQCLPLAESPEDPASWRILAYVTTTTWVMAGLKPNDAFDLRVASLSACGISYSLIHRIDMKK